MFKRINKLYYMMTDMAWHACRENLKKPTDLRRISSLTSLTQPGGWRNKRKIENAIISDKLHMTMNNTWVVITMRWRAPN